MKSSKMRIASIRNLVIVSILTFVSVLFVKVLVVNKVHDGGAYYTGSSQPIFVAERTKAPTRISIEQLSKFGTQLVASSWGQPTASVALHMLRMEDSLRRVNADQTAEKVREFEYLLLNDPGWDEIEGGLPLLLDSPYGASFRNSPAFGSESSNRGASFDSVPHDDQLLAIFFESGRSLDAPITTPSGNKLQVSDMLNDSIATFKLGRELEWTLIAYCGYYPNLEFQNSAGDTFDLLELIDILLTRIADGDGACNGIHRLIALAICRQRLLYELEKTPDVSRAKEMKKLVISLEKHFESVSVRLSNNQNDYGYWDASWAQPLRTQKDNLVVDGKTLGERARVTGHLIEWLSLVPSSLWPEKRCVDRLLSPISKPPSSAIRRITQISTRCFHRMFLPG